jgi:hypothetical protein
MSESLQSVLGILRLAVEKSWRVGLLLVVFCEAALLASSRGASFPLAITEWSNVGLVLGIACIIVWLVDHLGLAIANFVEKKTEDARERRDVLANVDSLTDRERYMLYSVLKETPRRFKIVDLGPAWLFVERGIFRVVTDLRDGTLCELHPAVKRKKLIAKLALQFRGASVMNAAQLLGAR